MSRNLGLAVGAGALIGIFGAVYLAGGDGPAGPVVLGVRGEFLLFALTLAGVALFHHHTLQVALIGLGSVPQPGWRCRTSFPRPSLWAPGCGTAGPW